MKSWLLWCNAGFARIPSDLVLFFLRLFPALVFWQSGRTKMEGWFTISDNAYYLFKHEYALPLIPSEWATVMAATAEHVLPILLIIGLLTRISAFALLLMTLVIQIFVYPEAWLTHGLWISAFLAVMALGPGRFSLDRQLRLETLTRP